MTLSWLNSRNITTYFLLRSCKAITFLVTFRLHFGSILGTLKSFKAPVLQHYNLILTSVLFKVVFQYYWLVFCVSQTWISLEASESLKSALYIHLTLFKTIFKTNASFAHKRRLWLWVGRISTESGNHHLMYNVKLLSLPY